MTTTTIRTPLDRRGLVSLVLVVALALVAAALVAAALVRVHQPASPAGLTGIAAGGAPVTGTLAGQHSGALAARHHDGGRTERADAGAASAPVAAGNRSWVREDGGRAEG